MSKQLGRLTELGLGMIPLPGHTRTFQLLIRHIGEARTKFEEDKIIAKEVTFLRQNLMAPEVSPKQLMEFIIRMIYVEMLGHDASFGYIQAVKLTQHSTLMARRLGYMASAMFLHKNPDLGMLLVNSLQKDLKCPDTMRVCMALVCLGHTITPEMLPVALPLVKDSLSHPKEIVRKKAIVVLYKLYRVQNLNEGATSVLTLESAPLVSLVERCLSDKDPGVMSSGLSVLYKLVLEDPVKFKGLIDSMVSILKQIISLKVSPDFEYHSVPLPWTQIKMLQILAILGKDDLNISKRMYDVLDICLAKANMEVGQLIGKALIFECVRTISSIYPDSELIRKSACVVGKFLSSPSNNIKYFGITALSLLVQVDPQHALEHQEIIMRCLGDPDDTLKRKTLELLCRITGPENVSIICSKLTEYLETVTDQFIRGDFAKKITLIAEKHAPNHDWFLVTVSRVFRLAGDLVDAHVSNNLLRLIAEGIDSEDERTEREFREKAVNLFHNILVEMETGASVPDSLVRIVAWVLSEYIYFCPNLSPLDTASRLAKIFREGKRSNRTHNWILQAVIKLALHHESVRTSVHTLFSQSNLYLDLDSQQRWNEFNGILNSTFSYDSLHPLDGSCEELGVDQSLSFLSGFVAEAQKLGAPAYQPLHLRNNIGMSRKTAKPSEINYKPYEPPTKPVPKLVSAPPPLPIPSPKKETFTPPIPQPAPVENSVHTSTRSNSRPWSVQGYRHSNFTQEAPSPEIKPREFTADKLNSNFAGYEPDTTVSNFTADVTIPTTQEDPKRREAQSIFGHLAPKQGGGILSQTERKPRRSLPNEENAPIIKPLEDVSLIKYESHQENSVPPEQELEFNSALFQQTPLISDLAPVEPTSNSLLSNTLLTTKETLLTTNDTLLITNETLLTTNDTLLTSNETLLITNDTTAVAIELKPNSEVTVNTEVAPEVASHSELSEVLLADAGSQESGFAFIKETFPLAHLEGNRAPELSPELTEFPRDEQNFLVSDVNIRVTYVKVFKPKTLVIFLVITNQIQEELTELLFKYQFPSNIRHTQGEVLNAIKLDSLTGFSSYSETLELRCTAPAMNPTVSGELSYRDSRKTQQRLFFNLIVSIRDLMRPLPLTAAEFEKEWSSSLMFKKRIVTLMWPTGVSGLSDFSTLFRQKVNVQEADRKGSEVLFVGIFLSNVKSLFHATTNAKLSATEVTVLTKNQLLTDSIAHFLEKSIK